MRKTNRKKRKEMRKVKERKIYKKWKSKNELKKIGQEMGGE